MMPARELPGGTASCSAWLYLFYVILSNPAYNPSFNASGFQRFKVSSLSAGTSAFLELPP